MIYIQKSLLNLNLIKTFHRNQTLAMASALGVPRKSVIKSNWCTTFFPGKSGFPVKSSAKMQPMLHISIAGVY